jgi:hypothetical protein
VRRYVDLATNAVDLLNSVSVLVKNKAVEIAPIFIKFYWVQPWL